MLRLQNTDVATACETKFKKIEALLEKFAVRKTILNKCSACFQINVSLTLVDVSYLWNVCSEIQQHYDCRCFLTLSRLGAESSPRIQIIVDLDDSPMDIEDDEEIERDVSVESLLEKIGCSNSIDYTVLHVPGAVLIRCSLPLDKDGILDLGTIVHATKRYRGIRCRNVYLFGNYEIKHGIQTIYVTLDQEYDDEDDDDDDTGNSDDDDGMQIDIDENSRDKEDGRAMDVEAPVTEEAPPPSFVDQEQIMANVRKKDVNDTSTDEEACKETPAATTIHSSTPPVTNSKGMMVSRFARTHFLAALTGLVGIIIPAVHLMIKSKYKMD